MRSTSRSIATALAGVAPCLLALSHPASAAVDVETLCPGVECPCGNDDPTAGCGNAGSDGDAQTGARLLGLGSSDVALDDLALRVSGVKPGAFGLVFMGAAAGERRFGDGLRCVSGGGVGVFRFPLRASDDAGTFVQERPVEFSQSFGSGAIRAGATWYFQAWYRDPSGPCGTGSNLTNALGITFDLEGRDAPVRTQLAGRPLEAYPYFEFPRAFNEGSEFHVSVDPTRHPTAAGATPDLFVVAAKTEAEWDADPSLVDVRGAPQPLDLTGSDVQANTFTVELSDSIRGTQGTAVGVGFDLVLDLDRDRRLGPGDLIDGLSDEAGAYVVRDTTRAGPYGVSQILYSGGSFLGQTTYFPTEVDSLGELPLVVVSHGNGHNYQWYDHIGFQLASYGYVVMSHQNNTVPGSFAASTTTLRNTDYLLGNLERIEGGVLAGHVDGSRITWIGHSRGGDGVVRAYNRIVQGTYIPEQFGAEDIVLISSMAPVDFGGPANSNPHGVNYHLWTGSADADVNGGPASDVAQTFHLLDRAVGTRMATTVHGAGHGTFHAGPTGWVANGPCLLGRFKVHRVMRGYFVPLLAHFVRGEVPAKDFLWRQWEGYKPIGGLVDDCAFIQLEYVDGPAAGNFVVDDFQTNPEPELASSGATVTFDVTNLFEGLLDDNNNSFTTTPDDPMNGMTRGRAEDTTRGVVFDWSRPSYIEYELPPDARDLTTFRYVSLKACQATRHPNTVAELADVTFSVTLRDLAGRESTIPIAATGAGLEEPYQRTGAGDGAGWANEFETLRLRLLDFRADGARIDLGSIAALRLEFGGPGDSSLGRIGLDDVEFTRD